MKDEEKMNEEATSNVSRETFDVEKLQNEVNELKLKLEKAESERDEAHRAILRTGRSMNEEKKTYEKMMEGII